jgi:hypothetical protein
VAALTFILSGNAYIATYIATADFNIHLEREASGGLSIEMSHLQNGEFTQIPDIPQWGNFDRSFHDVVYPIYLRIISCSAPIANKCVIKEAE